MKDPSKTQDRMIAGLLAGNGTAFAVNQSSSSRRCRAWLRALAEDWRGGPDAGKPKLPPMGKGLIARGLMRLGKGPTFHGCSSPGG